MVHGSGAGWEYWDVPLKDHSFMDDLARRGFDVYAVQCRGYGKSTKPNGMTVTAVNIAGDLKSVIADIMKRSKVNKVSIAGHSSGGTVALVAAGTSPELLERMVIIGTCYKKRVGENYRLMPGGIFPDSVGKNPDMPFVATMKVPTLILNGSKESVVQLDDPNVGWKEKGRAGRDLPFSFDGEEEICLKRIKKAPGGTFFVTKTKFIKLVIQL
ncbi:MAG: alpha/beta hydrolase [Thermodesulfobacteriota bacterium]